MIPEDKVAEIRERTDAVALIQAYVPLKQVGTSFRGLCPFHPEKTPSFYVNPVRQFFHCFGCRASGDVFAFMMRLEGHSFPEVARILAERAGVELPVLNTEEESRERRHRQRAERLYALLEAAAGFYVDQLGNHPLAAPARAELEGRGVSPASARLFRLGYAPHGWDALGRFLREGGLSPSEAEEVGLLVPRRGGDGHYDRFRHRLVFPIADHQGRIVAFSGRALESPAGEPAPAEPPAKYVNSPEGPLYKKGEILFGLHEGRVELRRQRWALICEGNFDLVALHQAGLSNAVAPLGTAFTPSHAKLLRRYVERAVLLFDGDHAGRKAVAATYPLLREAGLGVRVVVLPAGDDPDSFLRREGPEALRARIDGAPDAVSFLIDDAAELASGDPSQKAQAIAELGPLLASLDNPIEARLYVERIARRFAVPDLDAVRQQLRKGARDATRRDASRHHRDAPSQVDDATHQVPKNPELPSLEAQLVGAIVDHPDLAATEEGKILLELLTSPPLRAIFEATFHMMETSGVVDGPGLLARLQGNPARTWLEERLAIQRYDAQKAKSVLRDGIPLLARQNIERELPRLREEILRARREGDDDRAQALTRERDVLYVSSKRWLESTVR